MKYFTKELVSDYGQDISKRWEENSKKYFEYLSQIKDRLPVELSSLIPDTYFHDGELAIEIKDNYRGFQPFGCVELKVKHAHTGILYHLIYDKIRKFSYDFPTDEPLDDSDEDFYFGEWLYDEIELLDGNWVKHEILLSSGAQICIEFRKFSSSKEKGF